MALVIVLAGCTTVRFCKTNTVFLTLNYDSTSSRADSLTIVLSDGIGSPNTYSVRHSPGAQSDSVEIDFASAYPAGATLTVSITAKQDDSIVASVSQAIVLSSACTHASFDVRSGGVTSDMSAQIDMEHSDGAMDGGVVAGPIVFQVVGATTIYETDSLNLSISATTSATLSPLTLSASNVPTGATFMSTGSGTATLTWTPTYAQAGNYTVTIDAKSADNVAMGSYMVVLKINNYADPIFAPDGSNPAGVAAIGDIDGDGLGDLAYCSANSATSTYSIFVIYGDPEWLATDDSVSSRAHQALRIHGDWKREQLG